MPPNTATLRVGPYFLSLLLLLLVLFGLVFLPGQRRTPKLGLDLEGGAQVTLQAQTPNGKTPNQSAMKVARGILENRVNANGVSAAQVYQQGNNQIVIAVPGANSQDVARVGQAAKLNFRSVLFAAVPNTATTTTTPTTSTSGSVPATSSGATPTSSATTAKASTPAGATNAPTSSGTTAPKASTSPNGLLDPKPLAAGTTAKPATAAKTTAAKTTAAKTTAAAPTTTAAAASALSVDPFKNIGFTLPKTNDAFNALTTTQQAALKAALANFDCTKKPADVAEQPLAACDVPVGKAPATYKYLLSAVIVPGTQVSSADAVAPSANGNTTWSVSINLKDSGQKKWATFTSLHHSTATTDSPLTCSATTTPCADYVAFTLDGAVITAPQTNGTINGTTQVTGTFTESYAKDLANDLKYGALPLNFTQLTQADVSPTLGSNQLKAGLLAGGIGLLLVVIYSFLYYRGLGFVTVFSLLVSGGLTYAMLVILGREIGFTLTLAGIAGFIVAVGITADSFVVLFERLKDEVHSGRSLRVAVPRAWTRARRTILSADTVSFIAAAVLYYFTVGDVRGFAFTLGLSTVLDLVVVFLFTHPLVSLLSRSKAFGSPRFTGLDSVRSGGIAPSPEAPARAAKARRTAAGGSSTVGAGSVALLEREDHLVESDDDFVGDDDSYDDDVAAPVATAAPAATREPNLDSGAPRRSRVVPRTAPAAEIGADAAERAAARRGRTVRPPKPVIEEPDDDPDAEADDDLDVTDASDSVVAAAVGAEPDGVIEVAEPAESVVEVETEPAPAVRPRATSRWAERAAARRRRPGRGATAIGAQSAEDDSGEDDSGDGDTADTDIVDADPDVIDDATDVAEPTGPTVVAELEPAAPVRPRATSTSADRAAARRSRPGRGATAVGAESVQTAPVDTAPVDTAPVDTASVDTASADTASADTASADTEPVEAESVGAEVAEFATDPAPVVRAQTADVEPAVVEEPEPEVEAEDAVTDAAAQAAPTRPTTAAERAAARRARIRTRATATPDREDS